MQVNVSEAGDQSVLLQGLHTLLDRSSLTEINVLFGKTSLEFKKIIYFRGKWSPPSVGSTHLIVNSSLFCPQVAKIWRL